MSPHKEIIETTSFYDKIAPAYDEFLTGSDTPTRDFVSSTFKTHVPAGNVLDFGGGTGMDLPWLLCGNYRVFFLEPSSNMRAMARRVTVPEGVRRPLFIEENTDIANWTTDYTPLSEKMDGIVANFAVLNCMEHMPAFFEKIALISRQGCRLFALVINPNPRALAKNYSYSIAAKMLFKRKLRMLNNYEGFSHEVFIHSLSSLRSASKKYFHLTSSIPVKNSNFILLQFTCK